MMGMNPCLSLCHRAMQSESYEDQNNTFQVPLGGQQQGGQKKYCWTPFAICVSNFHRRISVEVGVGSGRQQEWAVET